MYKGFPKTVNRIASKPVRQCLIMEIESELPFASLMIKATKILTTQKVVRIFHYTLIITSAYTTLRPINPAHSRYLYYLIHAFDLKKGFYDMGSGVRQGLNYDEVKELRVVLPSQAEQDTIVNTLDQQCALIDAIIQDAQDSINEYVLWRKSVIFEAVTKGLDSSVEMKESRIEWVGLVPKHWKISRIKNELDNLDYLREPISAEKEREYSRTV